MEASLPRPASSEPAAAAAKPVKPQTLLTVTEVQQISPHMVRVFLGGADFPQFAALAQDGHTDMYVKLVFNQDGTVPQEKFSLAEARASRPAEQVPVTRTYTVRFVDPVNQEIALDFVTHGSEGLAAPWAQRAQPGDRLLIQGPGGAYSPDPAAQFHLLVGDESAIPAIAASLETLPEGTRGLVIIEVESEEDVLELDHPDTVTVEWIRREGAGHSTTRLAEAVREHLQQLKGEEAQVFAHGERGAVKELRSLFREMGVPRERLSISAYWAAGRTEDVFQAEKKQPIGKIG